MNWLKENWIKVLILVVVVVAASIGFLSKVSPQIIRSVEMTHFAYPVDPLLNITCKYPQLINGRFNENTITHEIPPPEKQPFIFTFNDIQEDSPTLKYVDATKTISEVPLIRIYEDSERVVLIEGTGESYFAMHTIFKASGVSIYSKQLSLLGIPYSSMAIGTCM